MAAYEELTNTELLALPTHRLYAIYQLYRQNSYYMNYHENDESDEGYRMRCVSVNNACEFIKAELDKRGHIPRKHENVERESGSRKKPQRSMSWLRREQHEVALIKQHVGSINPPEDAIGLQVYKKSKKPFKSKNLYNTVKSVTINQHTGRAAYDFEEDSSIVDAHLCHLRKVKK